MTIGNAAFEEVIHPVPGLYASADLSAYQHRFVTISGDGTVTFASHTNAPVGVLCNKPLSGKACTIAGPGSVAKLEVAAAGAITAGAFVAPDNTSPANLGKAITATTGDYPAAIALVGGNAGDLIPVLFIGAGKVL